MILIASAHDFNFFFYVNHEKEFDRKNALLNNIYQVKSCFETFQIKFTCFFAAVVVLMLVFKPSDKYLFG